MLSPRAARWIVWFAVVLFAILTAIGLVLQAQAGRTTFNLGLASLVASSVIVGLWVAVGAVIVIKRPSNPVGWLLTAAVITWGPQMLAFGLVARALEAGAGTFPGYGLAMLWLSWTGAPFTLLSLTLLLLLYPSGHLLSRGWGAVGWIALVSVVGVLVTSPRTPEVIDPGIGLTSPYGLPVEQWSAVQPILQLSLGIGLLSSFAAALSLLLRFRMSAGVERQQLKWLAYAGFPVMVAFAVNSLAGTDVSDPLVVASAIALDVAFLGFAVAIGFSILRYRLYDIDLIINRSMVYGALTLTLAAIYFASVAVFQNLIRLAVGQQSPIAIVASTLVVAALFHPLRRRLQRFIDQRFYRARYDGARMLEHFATTLSGAVEVESQVDLLLYVVDDALRPAHVSLWMRSQRSPADDRRR